jgi:hypothetical protein
LLFDLLQIPLCPYVDERDQRGSETQSNEDAYEAKPSDSLARTMNVGENINITIEKGKEHDVDDCKVQGQKHDYRLEYSD